MFETLLCHCFFFRWMSTVFTAFVLPLVYVFYGVCFAASLWFIGLLFRLVKNSLVFVINFGLCVSSDAEAERGFLFYYLK